MEAPFAFSLRTFFRTFLPPQPDPSARAPARDSCASAGRMPIRGLRPRAPRRSPASAACPIFPNTRKGLLERLAYYEARKLNNLPTSLLDYHDVIHGHETPDERRAREARATARR